MSDRNTSIPIDLVDNGVIADRAVKAEKKKTRRKRAPARDTKGNIVSPTAPKDTLWSKRQDLMKLLTEHGEEIVTLLMDQARGANGESPTVRNKALVVLADKVFPSVRPVDSGPLDTPTEGKTYTVAQLQGMMSSTPQ